MNKWLHRILEIKTGALVLVFLFLFFLLFLPASAAGTETLITTHENGFNHQVPKISGNLIVWQDSLIPAYDSIHLYNLSSGIETRISDNLSYVRRPVISGDLVAWIDCADDFWCMASTVYLYNITSGVTIPVSGATSPNPDMPAIYGNRIVWHDCSGANCYIFINGTSPGLESRITSNESSQLFPSIYGNGIAWSDDRNDPGSSYDIYRYDLATLVETRITADANNQIYPAVYDNRIVWQDYRNANPAIYINGTEPGLEYSLTPDSPVPSENPAIFGNLVVWQQAGSGSNTDIFLNDTATGVQMPVAVVPPGSKTVPSVSFSKIVWQDDRNGNDDIYLYTNGAGITCPDADFAHDFSGGAAPATVHFVDQSTSGASHWFWDFGDGSNSILQNPAHTYLQNLPYDVSLTVGNPACRNTIKKINNVIVGSPVADFTASTTSDIVPVLITFNDQSSGIPTTWSWDFGDGATSGVQNPSHEYTAAGTYSVSLTAANTYGSSVKSRNNYITILNGANEAANTTIHGLSVVNCAGAQSITVDTSVLPAALIPNNSVLEIQPPQDRGFKNITLFALDGSGFSRYGTIISGNVTGVHLETRDIHPVGFAPDIGYPVSVYYSADLSSYPCDAGLFTKIWESAIAEDRDAFQKIALGSHFSTYHRTAYTMKITRTNIPAIGMVKLHMSVNSTWVSSIADGRNQTFIERISDNRATGEVLSTPFRYYDPVNNLDYFEADSPHGLSTFGLSQLSGSGNPLQLITLSVARHISPSTDNTVPDDNSVPDDGSAFGKSTAPATVQAVNPPAALAPIEPGKTEKIYSNAQGVITQATVLKSTDQRAQVTIGLGVVAKDPAGGPLTSITLMELPADRIAPGSTTSRYSFAGMAYNLGPDGATFSPAISLSFSIPPEAPMGQEYSVKSLDPQSGTWNDLPTSVDPGTGKITAQISHFCCFALFAKPLASANPSFKAPVPLQTQVPIMTPAPPPATAISIFIGMMTWIIELVINNVFVLVIVVILGIAYGVKKRKYPGSGR